MSTPDDTPKYISLAEAIKEENALLDEQDNKRKARKGEPIFSGTLAELNVQLMEQQKKLMEKDPVGYVTTNPRDVLFGWTAGEAARHQGVRRIRLSKARRELVSTKGPLNGPSPRQSPVAESEEMVAEEPVNAPPPEDAKPNLSGWRIYTKEEVQKLELCQVGLITMSVMMGFFVVFLLCVVDYQKHRDGALINSFKYELSTTKADYSALAEEFGTLHVSIHDLTQELNTTKADYSALVEEFDALQQALASSELKRRQAEDLLEVFSQPKSKMTLFDALMLCVGAYLDLVYMTFRTCVALMARIAP